MDEIEQIAETRAKFREALEKKKKKGASGTTAGPGSGSQVIGGQSGVTTKRFQRKSGSA